jgi:uncharacterized protein
MFDRLRDALKSRLPTPEQLAQQRWLGPVAHRLADRGLWHAKTESVARGVAIGMLYAFLVPFAQIVFAAAHCIWWRGNIPAAVAITFITNPFTVGGWLYLAHQVGNWVLPGAPPVASGEGWLAQLQALGGPTLLGMALFAMVGAIGGYLLVRVVSRLWFQWRFTRRAIKRR